MSYGNFSVLDPVFSRLAASGVITPASNPRFIAGVFPVPKSDGSYRAVIDLSPLNSVCLKTKFKMERIEHLLDLIEPGGYLVKMDMEQAYHAVPLHPLAQELVCFVWRDRVWQFTRLCFGLGDAPRVYTMLWRQVMKHLRLRGFLGMIYLDDLSLTDVNRDRLTSQVSYVQSLLPTLGFTLCHAKSILVPTQEMEYLGLIINTVQMTISLPKRRVTKMTKGLSAALSSPPTLRNLMSLLGLIESCRPVFPSAPLYYRDLQSLILALQSRGDPLTITVTLPPPVREELEYWKFLAPRIPPRCFRERIAPQVILTTDSSLSGWGAWIENHQAKGQWSPTERSKHINHLELLAVIRAFQHLPNQLKGKKVLLRSDSKTALSYIRRFGGTRSPGLCLLARELWALVLEYRSDLQTEHIAGEANDLADALSRDRESAETTTEWTLSPSVFRTISRKMGPLRRDLFASPRNAHLPDFFSWISPHHQMDAFSVRWQDGDYIFPPFSLLSRVIRKIREDQCRVVLVAPYWPSHPWFPVLDRLVPADCNRRFALPHSRSLLVDEQGSPHPMGRDLRLMAWAF